MLEIFPGLLIPIFVTVLGVLVALFFVVAPRRTRHRGGFLGGVIAFVALPGLVLSVGSERQIALSKKTEFCMSCHVMHPYGNTLLKADDDVLSGIHYANHYVPPDSACYPCHIDYTMFGGLQAKLKGLKHVWVNYVSGVPDPIELYEPFHNRVCLHCHEGAKKFNEAPGHQEALANFKADVKSCIDCHGPAHGVEKGEVTAAANGTQTFELPPEAYGRSETEEPSSDETQKGEQAKHEGEESSSSDGDHDEEKK